MFHIPYTYLSKQCLLFRSTNCNRDLDGLGNIYREKVFLDIYGPDHDFISVTNHLLISNRILRFFFSGKGELLINRHL